MAAPIEPGRSGDEVAGQGGPFVRKGPAVGEVCVNGFRQAHVAEEFAEVEITEVTGNALRGSGQPGRRFEQVLQRLGRDHENPREADAMEALERQVLDSLGYDDPYTD